METEGGKDGVQIKVFLFEEFQKTFFYYEDFENVYILLKIGRKLFIELIYNFIILLNIFIL